MNATWNSKEWKRNKEAFLKVNPFCLWHGSPVKATVPHHAQRRSLSEKSYVSLKGCIPLCQKCHYAAKKRMKLCPVCKTHYFKPRRNRKMCWECFTKTSFGQAVKNYYDKKRVEDMKIKRRRKTFESADRKPQARGKHK
jgi:hypothetical protein